MKSESAAWRWLEGIAKDGTPSGAELARFAPVRPEL